MSMLQFIRHAGRYREMLSVLVGFGFREFFEEARLDLLLEKGQRLFHPKAKPEVDHLSRPERLRMALEALGPTFIKLGQVLSTRPDMVPPEYIVELQKLQDGVPAVAWPAIQAQLIEDLGDLSTHFKSVDETPLAAASMAQAHVATRHDDARIVLKILRPGIDKIINADMEILQAVAAWVVQHVHDLPFDPVAVIGHFSEAMRYELDLQHEGRNTDIFRANLEPDEQACFPEVHWDVTRTRVLGLELIEGVQLSKWQDADLSLEQRSTIVRNGAYTVLRQVLDKGFFHADPHPGNLFAMPDGKLCFIDCGMAGRVDRETVGDLAHLMHGVAENDIDAVYEAFMSLGRVHEGQVNERALRRDLQAFLDEFTSKSFADVDMTAVLSTFTEGLRKHRIKCPGDIVLMIKALTTIEGVAESLDPEFDLVTFARPHIERLIKAQYSVSAVRGRLKKNALAWLRIFERAPHQLRTMIERALRNELRLSLDVDGLPSLERTVHHASRQMSFAILVAAMIMASAVLVLAAGTEGHAMKIVGFSGFVISFGLAGLLLLESWLRRPKDKRRR